MPRDDCARFEESLLSHAEIGDDLRAHAASCPRCQTLLGIAGLRAPKVASASDDALLASVLAATGQVATARAARYERRRRLIPFLIGTAGYLIGAVGLAAAFLTPATYRAATGEIPLPYATLALPPPSPAAVLIACAISLAWITGLVLIAGRRQAEGNGVTT